MDKYLLALIGCMAYWQYRNFQALQRLTRERNALLEETREQAELLRGCGK